MTIFTLIMLGTQVRAGIEALSKYGFPQIIRGVKYKSRSYKITIECDD